jgi:RimJ/RimL family protein N-acetyltransferase
MGKQVEHHLPIYKFGEIIGHCQLVKDDNASFYQLEYFLKEEHRNQGIMTVFLPAYLATLKNKRIIAIAENDNEASKKLLLKNGFLDMTKLVGLFPEFARIREKMYEFYFKIV